MSALQLVVNRSKERKNKLRKKADNGDISTIENYCECLMFGLKGASKIEFQADPTRESSLHDSNLSEIRELILALMGKKINIPKYFKVKNAPFIRRVVHIHISDVPVAMNANTRLSTGGSSALLAGLDMGAVRCIRVDKEVDELGHLPYKLLTVPYSKAAEWALAASPLPLPAPTAPTAGASDSTLNSAREALAGPEMQGCSAEERAAWAGLAQYVLSPAQLHLWGYHPAAAAAADAAVAAIAASLVQRTNAEHESAASNTDEGGDAHVSVGSKRSMGDAGSCDGPEAKRSKGEAGPVSTKDCNGEAEAQLPSYVRGSAAVCLPTSHALAMQLLRDAKLLPAKGSGATTVAGMQHYAMEQCTLFRTSAAHQLLWSSIPPSEDPPQHALVASVDCEMCQTDLGAELTRVSVLGHDGSLLLDTLVKPNNPVRDYLTQYSGMTEELLRDVTVTIEQVQVALLRLVSADAILVGHSLDSDLRALRLYHRRCVDTAISYPHPRGYPLRLKLRKLAEDYLQQRIQTSGSDGHDSTEDARAALQLAMLKVANGPLFGVKKPDQQRCPVLGVLDAATTSAVLVWQGTSTSSKNTTAQASAVTEATTTTVTTPGGTAVSSTLAVVLETDTHGAVGEENGNPAHSAESCVGGNAVIRHASSAAQVVELLCEELTCSPSEGALHHEVTTTDDKAAGPISSWVTSAPAGSSAVPAATEVTVEALSVPKNRYLFGNICYHAAGSGSGNGNGAAVSAEESEKFALELRAQIQRVRDGCSALSAEGTTGGSTLLLVTAQDSLQPVLALMQRKRLLSRAAMATAMWSPEEEMRLREARKHNLAFMCAAVL